jgi:glycine/D-amino acid oxidase-like deaminating enzyme
MGQLIEPADNFGVPVPIRGEIMRVVICGGGVIGACTAYFLSRRGIDVTVVERAEVAAAASGKAGGFLALDWCGGTPLDGLARRSFQLHADLPTRLPVIGPISGCRPTAGS